jgi:hypothetical protein
MLVVTKVPAEPRVIVGEEGNIARSEKFTSDKTCCEASDAC